MSFQYLILLSESVRRPGWFGQNYVAPCCEDSPVNVLLGNIVSGAVAVIQDIINSIWQLLFQRKG